MTSLAEKRKIRNSELADFFECPVCTEYALPPIYQCKSGHVICSVCRLMFLTAFKPLFCPTCRQPMDEIRNLVMERISSRVAFPCENADAGCPVKAIPCEKERHENVCLYRKVPCPLPQYCYNHSACKWEGKTDKIIAHIYRDHPYIGTFEGQNIRFSSHGIFEYDSCDWIALQVTDDKTFLVVLTKKEEEMNSIFYAFVVLLDSPELFTRYTYRVEMKADEMHLFWKPTPKKVLHERSDNFECLKFDGNMAALFEKNGDLCFNVIISKVHN